MSEDVGFLCFRCITQSIRATYDLEVGLFRSGTDIRIETLADDACPGKVVTAHFFRGEGTKLGAHGVLILTANELRREQAMCICFRIKV